MRIVWWITALAGLIPLGLLIFAFILNLGVFVSDGFGAPAGPPNPVGEYIPPLVTAAAVAGIVLPAFGLLVSVPTRQALPIVLNAGVIWLTIGLIVRGLVS
jgi:hypothetical protein